LTPEKAPSSSFLTTSGAFLKIAINNNVNSPTQPTLYATYPFDGGALTPVGSVSKVYNSSTVNGITYDRFTLNNVIVFIPNVVKTDPPTTLPIGVDVFSTNGTPSQPNSPIQCVSCGSSFLLNDPTVVGQKICGNPRTYNLNITTTSTVQHKVLYRIYADVINAGVVDDNGVAGYQAGFEDRVLFTSDSITIYDGAGTLGNFSITGGALAVGSGPFANYTFLVRVDGNNIPNAVDAILQEPIECIPLPVNFKSFNANRTSASNVAITWITASEQNSKGFNVQKNVGGEWKTIAFVPSQAQGGNSSSDLTYSFRDANNEKGITQYRIQQVDLDGNAKYSDIRAIRGEGTVGKVVVYPNPSVDGKLNIVFEDNSAIRDIQVNDMQGRVVKSYKGISNNILVIEKLTSGFYTIKITNRNTAATSVEKVVVK
jgi:hypothetical protein